MTLFGSELAQACHDWAAWNCRCILLIKDIHSNGLRLGARGIDGVYESEELIPTFVPGFAPNGPRTFHHLQTGARINL